MRMFRVWRLVCDEGIERGGVGDWSVCDCR